MKNIRVLSLSIVILFVVVSCNKLDTSKFTGTYTGTLTSMNLVKENVQLTFTNVQNKKKLSIFGSELEKISENQFNADASVILEIIHLIDTNITKNMIVNASAAFVFDGDEVTMSMKYSISHKMTNTVNVIYIGNK
jgi:hypothetical protein